MPVFYACLLCDLLVNGDTLLVAAHALKTDNAVLHGKERIVAALADVGAGMDFRAALADEDIAGQNKLTISSLGAKTL